MTNTARKHDGDDDECLLTTKNAAKVGDMTVARELRELRETVQALSSVVGRFVVVLERQLASNDAVSERSRNVLAKLHPEMDRISAEVRAKAGGRKPAR